MHFIVYLTLFRERGKICIFAEQDSSRARDMICMRQQQHSSWHRHQKCTFINFMFHCFSCKFRFLKNSIISHPDMCIWFPLMHDFSFFFLSPLTWLNSIWFLRLKLASPFLSTAVLVLLLHPEQRAERHHHCITRSRCNTIYMAWIVIIL